MGRLSLFLLLAILAGCANAAAGRWPAADLESWIQQELEPYLVQELATHPRFTRQTIRIVTATGDEFGRGSNLAAAIRDRIERTLSDAGRVSVVSGAPFAGTGLTCNPDAGVAYYLAIDVATGRGPVAVADVRAYDLGESAWVPGFGRKWRGELTRTERRAATSRSVVAEDRGTRKSPFEPSQEDLAAERLARELGCQLLASAVDEKTATITVVEGDPFAGLVSANLSRLTGLRAGSESASLSLAIKRHALDGRLSQVWAVIDGADTDDTPVSFASSVYINGRPPAASSLASVELRDLPRVKPSPSELDVVEAEPTLELRAVVPAADCTRADRWQNGANTLPSTAAVHADSCFAIAVNAPEAGHVFLLNRDTRGRWVRVYPSSCSPPPQRANGHWRFPGGDRAFRWEGRSGEEVFYAIAVYRRDAVKHVQQLLGRVPDRCEKARNTAGWQRDLERLLESLGEKLAFGVLNVRHAAPGDIREVARR